MDTTGPHQFTVHMDSNTALPGNTTDPEVAINEYLAFRIVFILFYCLIFFLGVSGNCLVVYVVVRNKSMQTITNIFITNLAISDVMMCLLAVPFTPLSAFMDDWIFGEAICHILPMTLGVSVYVSTLTSTAIAIDRYFVIVYPFKPRMKAGVCLLLIVAIWIISISVSLPLGIYQQVSDDSGSLMCKERWPKVTARQFFTVTSLILQYIVPCSIISYCYIKVSLVLATRSRSLIGTGARSRDRDEIEIRRKRRTNRMLIAMISIFVVCWLPLNVSHIVSEYRPAYSAWRYFYLVFFTAHVIAMSSTVYNPFLYAWMNDNFRKEFKTVLPALFFRSSRHCYYGNSDTTQYTTVETNNPDARRPLRVSEYRTERSAVSLVGGVSKCSLATEEVSGGANNGANGAVSANGDANSGVASSAAATNEAASNGAAANASTTNENKDKNGGMNTINTVYCGETNVEVTKDEKAQDDATVAPSTGSTENQPGPQQEKASKTVNGDVKSKSPAGTKKKGNSFRQDEKGGEHIELCVVSGSDSEHCTSVDV